MTSAKYQRCTECDWKGDCTIDRFISCPNCGGFLILKSTVRPASNKKRSRLNKKRPKKPGLAKDEGYRLHRDPKGKGWVFVEGKSPKDAPAFLSNEDARRINACAVRRGLVKSRRWT